MVEVRSFVDAAPDLLRERGGGGRDLGDQGNGTGLGPHSAGQAHPGPPGQEPVHRQAHGMVRVARRRPVTRSPGELPRAAQRARGAPREPGAGRHEVLAETRHQIGRWPDERSDAADRPGRRASVRIPRRDWAGELTHPAEPGSVLAAGNDGHGADDLIEPAKGAGPTRRGCGWCPAVQREAADGHVGPAPDGPGGRLRVRGGHPDRRVRRGDRPRMRGGRRDMHRPRGISPRAEHLTTHPAWTWLRR